MRRVLLPLSLLLAACASGTGRFGRISPEPIFYPPPPDTVRIQFLMTVSDEEDARGADGGDWISKMFGDKGENRGITKPYGVDVNAGRIYVCDTMVQGLEILDIQRRDFRLWRPRGQGRLTKPINCTLDPETGRLYVTDTERSQVVVFDGDLTYVDSFGESEGRPVDVHIAGDVVWVTDLENAKIRAYDKRTFELIRSLPEGNGESEAVLRQPTNLWVQDGKIYVTDFGDFKVKVYTEEGRFIRSVGGFGRGLGQFVRPKGVAVDRSGRIYVVDAGFENVQVFDADGNLLMFFGGSYEGLGDMWLPAQIRISYDDLELYEAYVDPRFELEYVILVTNQYGPDRLNVYGFVSPRTGG